MLTLACWDLSPVMAPTTLSFFPSIRSPVPSTYVLAFAALTSAGKKHIRSDRSTWGGKFVPSPSACSCFPLWVQLEAPVAFPMASTAVPLTEWYWPLVWLVGHRQIVARRSGCKEVLLGLVGHVDRVCERCGSV